MIAYLFYHATLVEFLWTLIGVCGLYFNVSNFRDSNKNYDAIEALNGDRLADHEYLLLISAGHIRNEIFRMCKTITIITIGVLAMIAPNASSKLTSTALIITCGLFFIELMIVVPGVLDKRQRMLLGALDDERRQRST